MSRILNKVLPALFGSGGSSSSSNSSTLPTSPITTTSTGHTRTFRKDQKGLPNMRKEQQRTGSGFFLPSYTCSQQLRYEDFVKHVHASDLDNDAKVYEALKSAFVGIIGLKRFRALEQRDRKGPQAGNDAKEWERLTQERAEYWAGRQVVVRGPVQRQADKDKRGSR